MKDLTEIKVETGPGRIPGLRVGVAVANGLAWSLKIPVNGEKMVYPKYEEGEEMKILVTGGAGYIGSHTVAELLKS